jgi:hypothetical protein
MPSRLHRLLAAIIAAAALLGGCASGPPPLYTWGNYQATVYQYYQKDRTGLEEQIGALNEVVEKARADNRPVPPGLHAHLGLLYAQSGKGAEARQQFTEEKGLFPESGPYMDFLLDGKEQKQ